MDKSYNSWTWKEIIKGKTLIFLVLTVIITVILNNIADKGMTYLMNKDSQTMFTYNYSLGINGIILVIPGAFSSIFAIKAWLRLKSRLIRSPMAEKIGLSKTLENGISSKNRRSVSLFLQKSIQMLWKVLKYTFLAGFYLIGLIVNFLSSGFNSSGRSRRRSSYGRRSSNSNGRRKLKSDAKFEARRKQKEADHAWNHANKQANHNINTPHFNNRVHKANSKQRDANEAAKKARKL